MALGVFVLAGFGTGCATTAAPSKSGDPIAADLPAYVAARQVSAQQDVRAQQLLVQGMTRAYLDDHEAAVELYEEALRMAPDEATVISALAASHQALGDLSVALFYAQQAIGSAPDNVHYHHHLAELHLEAGEAEQAAEAYDALLARFPNDEKALLASAELLVRLGHTGEAVQRYEQLMASVGDDPVLLEQVLELYLRQGDDVRAEQALLKLIEAEANDLELRRMLSELYLRQGRQEEAVALYERALEQSGGDAETVRALSDLYRRQGDAHRADALLGTPTSPAGEDASIEALLDQARSLAERAETHPEAAAEAAQLLQRVLDQEPSHAEALAGLGMLRLRAGDYRIAAAFLDEALAEDPRDPTRWRRAADAHLWAGDAQRAVGVADEAMLLFPGRPELLSVYGSALLTLHQDEAALDAFEEALAVQEELEAEDADARETDVQSAEPALLLGALSLLHARQGDAATSEAFYHDALGYDDPSATALHYLALGLTTRGTDLDVARRLARQAVDRDPQNPLFMDTLGWVYLQMNNLDEAERWIGRAAGHEAAPASATEHYGDLQARLGNPSAARQLWQEALEQMPDNAPLQAKLEAP